MSRSSTIQRSSHGDRVTLTVSGVVDLDFDRQAFDVAAGALHVDWAGVRRITSHGVAAVIDAGRRIAPTVEVTWRASVALVLQMGMVANFSGPARVTSFFAPYWCGRCGCDRVVELQATEVVGMRAPAKACPGCGEALRFEELESDFFSWLEPAGVRGP